MRQSLAYKNITKKCFGIKIKIKAVYAMHLIDALGFSLIGIFIPVFILSQGYEFQDIIYFYIVHNIFLLATVVIAIIAGKRIGLQLLLVARLPFLFLYFLALLSWESLQFSYFLIAILSGIQAALYWMPFNIIFTRESKPKDMGKFVSRLIAYPQIVGIVGPLIGAVLIKFFGFRFLFAFAFLIIIFSVLPIFQIDIKKVKYDLNFKKGLKLFRKYKKYMIAELFDNFGGETEGIIWPVFVFLTLGSIMSIGFIGALVSVGSIIFTLLVGKWIDKGDYKFYMKIGALSLLAVWLVRFIADNSLAYYLTTVVSGFCLSLLVVPYVAKMTKIAKKEVVDEFIIFREFFFFLGRMILFMTALVLLGNIKYLFPLAGLAYLYFLFL